jgi:hypothetical protein
MRASCGDLAAFPYARISVFMRRELGAPAAR